MRKRLILIFVCTLSGLCAGTLCLAQDEVSDSLTTDELHVLCDHEFGALCLDITIEDFNNLGFTFGDSVDLVLDNGFTLEDIPYYSGYYVSVGDPLLCGYPGYPHVSVAYNYGDSMWEVSGADENTLAVVTLHEAGKYIETQELFQLIYADEQKEGEPDEVYANFREITGGSLKKEMFFRSASPCDNTHNRAAVTDDLAEIAGIRCVLNLADSQEELDSYRELEDYQSDYYDLLNGEENVILLNLGSNYMDENYAATLAEGVYEMTRHEGPYLIHCQEGKDRTGFACALLLALAGASQQEIVDDYIITYENYYGIKEEDDPDRYQAVSNLVIDFLSYLTNAPDRTDFTPEELKDGAENYLRLGGLTDEQITEIQMMLCN